jgi:hypothetical protein
MKNTLLSMLLLLSSAGDWAQAAPMGTAFTYQGRLTDGANPANGSYDLLFRLYDTATAGNAVGAAVQVAPAAVSNGLFTVTLDFGPGVFQGDARWLEIGVRPYKSGITIFVPYTTLTPRQTLTAAPYALYADAADRVTGDLALPDPAVINFGSTVRQMLNLWGTQYGIGVQANVLYQRTHSGFAWYKDGSHADDMWNAGAGGTALMKLNSSGALEINHTIPGFGLTVNSAVGSAAIFNGLIRVRTDSTIDDPQLRLEETQEGDFARLEFRSTTKPPWHIAVGGSQNVMNFYNKADGDVMSLSQDGVLTTRVLTITGGADLAEPFPISGPDIPSGSVVIIDDEHPGQLKLSERAYDTRVAGIVSGAKGIRPGLTLSQQGTLDGGQHVALSGRVYVQADASDAPIKPGDLLTTADAPGYAMRVTDHSRAQGAILGKAMGGLQQGKGLVLVLVTLQ